MAIGKLDSDGLGITLTEPLQVKVVLMTEDGTPLYADEPRTLVPGDTLSWKYPDDGLRFVCD